MGRDKCLLEFDGVPLWRRQYDLLEAVAAEVMVVAPVRPAWCPENVHWIADEVIGCGPLGGLSAALSSVSHARVIVLAVDLPQMSEAYLRQLLALSLDTCGAVPLLDGLFQPLSAVYPKPVASIVQEHLHRESDKSLQRLLRGLVARGAMRSVPVAEADRPCFRNLNTPAD
jgi:molybdopterin-guanine dinucleotide biosynthesis protein A